jgi:hypothetical protein
MQYIAHRILAAVKGQLTHHPVQDADADRFAPLRVCVLVPVVRG